MTEALHLVSWTSTTPGTWNGIYEAVDVAWGDDQTTEWDFTALTEEIVNRIGDRLPASISWQPHGGVFVTNEDWETVRETYDEVFREVFDEMLDETNENATGYTFEEVDEATYTDFVYAE